MWELKITFTEGPEHWDLGEREELLRAAPEVLGSRLSAREFDAFPMLLRGLATHGPACIGSASATLTLTRLD